MFDLKYFFLKNALKEGGDRGHLRSNEEELCVKI